jgi:hypothetical protein
VNATMDTTMDATMDATRKANMMTKATKVMKAKPLSQTIMAGA